MILIYLCILSLLLWIFLLLDPDQRYLFNDLLPKKVSLENIPKVSVVIPCRNEELVLRTTLKKIVKIDYTNYEVILVDDCSSDSTYKIAKSCLHPPHKVILGKEVPEDWAGKMWALQQGVENATGEWILFSDADILHSDQSISQLVSLAFRKDYDMVSVMVSLSTKSFWEKLLVPAFVYFFKILYPFKAIRNKKRKVAAAAGGCILIKKKALANIGGIAAIHKELIDDVALAKKAKLSGCNISLWLAKDICSIRDYLGIKDLWAMVARSAFTELKYSYIRLLFCTFGMFLLFLLPMYSIYIGILLSNTILTCFGIAAYLTMTITYLPAVQFYGVPLFFVLSMPLIGLLYMLMTLDSALKYTFGIRAKWKGRSYKN